jgi:hypothetical protein
MMHKLFGWFTSEASYYKQNLLSNEEKDESAKIKKPIILATPVDQINNLLETNNFSYKNNQIFYCGEPIFCVPNHVIGLGYTYYPIVFKSKKQIETKLTFYPMINIIRGYDFNVTVELTEIEIIKNIVNDNLQKSNHCFYDNIKTNEIFLDPKEVEKSIEELKTNNNVIGFMKAFNYLKFEIDWEDFYFDRYDLLEGRKLKFDTFKYDLTIELKMRPKNESRIFNHLIEIICSNKVNLEDF